MKNVRKANLILVFMLMSLFMEGQEFRIPLYRDNIPNANGTVLTEKIVREDITVVSQVQVPDIAVYLPSKRNATGQAIVICPGGGYWVLAYDWEGGDIARYLNSIGVAAIVLKYRLPVYGNTLEPHKAPLMDAQRAIRLVRYHAAAWNIDQRKIGIMGFSAGGHLASTAGTHFDYGNPAATDSVERMSCRPDFMVLMYPVVSFVDPAVHSGSSEALLGKNPAKSLLEYYSNELQVKDDTPPAFMVHADDDKGVPVENSLLMYKALRAKNISAELHILSEGEHGFALGTGNEHVSSWTNNLKWWLEWLHTLVPGSKNCSEITLVPQWTTYEITLISERTYSNAYSEIDVWAQFMNETEDTIVRPAFWDGGNTWKVRFAPPDSGTQWTWNTYASVPDKGLAGNKGSLRSVAYSGKNRLLKHGLLRMSPGKRNVVHADGRPFLVIGDTPWAIPFRATPEQVHVYAKDRQVKGFNTALLMSVQPDRYAEGPEARNTPLGFDRAFTDLPDGHLNQLKPDYFQTLDTLIQILVDHEIVPVYQPVFHGFGWKGLTVLGPTADPVEYARYCKYLVARYGSMPAFWLVSGDAHGLDPGVKPGGEAIEQWDAYGQPTGIHYNPADDYLASWANGDSTRCFHYNRSYQEEPWLDFQWAQTGHDGQHLYHKVERMYANQPVKANLNGEPTYEAMGDGKNGLGWWQGEEAWNQLMHGGTMGVVYGAATLWQWKVTVDEPGWEAWTDAPLSWREALDLEGSRYVGYVSRAFEGYIFTDMEKRWDLTENNRPLLAVEGLFYISYLENGGEITIRDVPEGLPFRWFDPASGEFTEEGTTGETGTFISPDRQPRVLIIGKRTTLP